MFTKALASYHLARLCAKLSVSNDVHMSASRGVEAASAAPFS